MSQASSQQLAMMRRVTATFLKDTCVLKRPQDAADEIGGSSNSYETVNLALACRILPLSDKNANFEVGQGEETRAYFRLIVPYDTDLQDGDRVEMNGVAYEIQQIEDVHTDATDKRARLMRIG